MLETHVGKFLMFPEHLVLMAMDLSLVNLNRKSGSSHQLVAEVLFGAKIGSVLIRAVEQAKPSGTNRL